MTDFKLEKIDRAEAMRKGPITQEELDSLYKPVGVHELDDIYTKASIMWVLPQDGFFEVGTYNPFYMRFSSIKVVSWHEVYAASWQGEL